MVALSHSRINKLAEEVNILPPSRILQYAEDDLHEAVTDSKNNTLFWQKYISHKLTKAQLEVPPNVAYLSSEQAANFAVKIHDATIQARTDKQALQIAVKQLAEEPVMRGRFAVSRPSEQKAAAASPPLQSKSDSSTESNQQPITKGRFTVTKPKTPSPPPAQPSPAGAVVKGRFTVTKPQEESPSFSSIKKGP